MWAYRGCRISKMVLKRNRGERLHAVVVRAACRWHMNGGQQLHKPYLGVLVHSSHSSAQEAAAGRLDLRTAWVT